MMEVKLLCQRPQLPSPALLRKLVPSQSFNLDSWFSTKKSIRNPFNAITEKWRDQILEMSKVRICAKYVLVHVVKEGETLTSIAEQYGISTHAIAVVNKSMVNVKLRQHLNIPCGKVDGPAFWNNRTEIHSSDKTDIRQSLDSLGGRLHQKFFTTTSTPHLPHGDASALLMVLVPLLAFCIRCIISALHAEVVKNMGKLVSNRSGYHSKTKRWRAILDDVDEPDDPKAQERLEAITMPTHPEDHDQTALDELSQDYMALHHDYQKFLADCGVSNYGYWHGGSRNEE